MKNESWRQNEAKAARKIISIMNRQKCRRFFVFALWGFFVVVLAGVYFFYTGAVTYSNIRTPAFISAIENLNNGLTYYRYDPNTNRLSFMAGATSLRAENAIMGIFRTAAAKSIKIRDLRLIFSDHDAVSALAEIQGLLLNETSNSNAKTSGRLAKKRPEWNADIDLSNAREVIIDNFNCRFFDGNDLRLGIKSRRAIVNSDWARIILRGHVIVTGPGGGTLESNCVKWDILKQTFTAEGTYVLKQGTNQIAGKNICVDSFLNIADTKNAGK